MNDGEIMIEGAPNAPSDDQGPEGIDLNPNAQACLQQQDAMPELGVEDA